MSWTAMRCSVCDAVTPCEHFPDLITWLRAQLDDDEMRIRGSGTLGWLTFRQPDGSMDHTEAASLNGGTWIVGGRERTGYVSADVVSRESERLAEIEAQRRILRTHSRRHDCAWIDGITAACSTVIFMAQPFADRAGFRKEWQLCPA